MFYSHEILTSRKYGVATVWLVATLGSRAYHRKVSKRDVLGVNVPKTCEIIINPEVPMALRLQSNLLAGVTRVHLQQWTYLLTDVQHTTSEMRRLMKIIRASDEHIDPEAGKAKPDQLIQPDDPNFLPAMLGIDSLPSLELDLTEPSSGSASVLSPRSSRSSRSSIGQAVELDIPSSSIAGGGIDLSGGLPGVASTIGRSARQRSEDHIDDDALIPDPGFAIDPGEDTFDFGGDDDTVPTQPLMSPLRRPSRAASIASARGSAQPPQDENEDEFSFQIPPDDGQDPALPSNVDPSAAAAHPSAEAPSEPEPPSSTSSAAVAPRRRARQVKALTLDTRTQLHNSELRAWQTNYLERMAKANEKRLALKASNAAKRVADMFLSGGGIGGIGFEVMRTGPNHPLAAFCGESLRDMLMGNDLRQDAEESRKRTSQEAELEEDEGDDRRVRPRSEEHGRAQEDEAPMMFDTGMDDDHDIEAGREAVSPMPDAPSEGTVSTLPWNNPAARNSSGHSLSNFQPARLSQQLARLGSSRAGGSRLTSASPLRGRGRPSSRQGSVFGGLGGGPSSDAGDGGGFDDDGVDPMQLGPNTQFNLFGPAAAVDTQTANDSQFIRQTLDTESINFLSFLAATISSRGIDVNLANIYRNPNDAEQHDLREREGEPDEDTRKAVLFAELLPVESNNHVVAAQGLLHVLALATRGLAWLRQEGWDPGADDREGAWCFGQDIWMGVTGVAVEEEAEDEQEVEVEAEGGNRDGEEGEIGDGGADGDEAGEEGHAAMDENDEGMDVDADVGADDDDGNGEVGDENAD